MQNRLKSKALWIAVASLVAFVAKTYFHYDIEGFNTLVDMILLILTLAGVFNNPIDKENF